MRSVVSMLLPSSWFKIHCRAPAYTPKDRNSDKVNDANWPNENTATKSRSSEVATVLMAASSENSRMICCDFDRKGTSSSSDARNTYQIIEPIASMLCCTPGACDAAASATVSKIQVLMATTQKRRSTIANGCGSMRYDQLSRPIIMSPSTDTLTCVHHQVSDKAPCSISPAMAAT